jgi:hypothetical protein
VVLAGFVLSLLGMPPVAPTRHRGAAAVAAVTFAFCPYVFGRTAHIQLLLMAGLPFSMLAFHRLVDQPSPARGLMLALVILLQTITCGYYGVFVVLMVGCAVPFLRSRVICGEASSSGRPWALPLSSRSFSGLLMCLPYSQLREALGFRTLDEARLSPPTGAHTRLECPCAQLDAAVAEAVVQFSFGVSGNRFRIDWPRTRICALARVPARHSNLLRGRSAQRVLGVVRPIGGTLHGSIQVVPAFSLMRRQLVLAQLSSSHYRR